jgi:hypothetical protein
MLCLFARSVDSLANFVYLRFWEEIWGIIIWGPISWWFAMAMMKVTINGYMTVAAAAREGLRDAGLTRRWTTDDWNEQPHVLLLKQAGQRCWSILAASPRVKGRPVIGSRMTGCPGDDAHPESVEGIWVDDVSWVSRAFSFIVAGMTASSTRRSNSTSRASCHCIALLRLLRNVSWIELPYR